MSINPPTKKDLPVGCEHLFCDGPECKKVGPTKRCSRCRTALYCSAKCQREHWKSGHKSFCKDFEKIEMNELKLLESRLAAPRDASPGSTVPSSNTSCAICLKDDMVDPFTLPGCGHTFCFLCLQNWQKTTNMNLTWNPNGIERRELTCPACRATTPDIVVSVLEVVQLHTIRANIDKAEKWTHFEQALEHLDRLDQIGALEKNQQQRLAALCTRGEVLMSLERWAEALEVFEECETLSEQGAQNMMAMYKRAEDHEQALNEGRHEDAEKIFREITEKKEGGMIMCKMDMDQVRLYRNIAMCKAETEDYEGALDVYKFKITPSMEHLSSMGYDREMPRESLLNSMGMAKCLYHLQDYENAIKAGVGALEFDRSYRQVHKHIALSLRAIGKLEDAIKIMGMAVNYEAPWDEQNRKINLELYQELRTASN